MGKSTDQWIETYRHHVSDEWPMVRVVDVFIGDGTFSKEFPNKVPNRKEVSPEIERLIGSQKNADCTLKNCAFRVTIATKNCNFL